VRCVVKTTPPPPDHMTNSHIPKVAAFPLRRRQRRHAAIEIEPQVVAVAAPPEELVEFVVAGE
jgi:hypothetical protein